MRFFRLSCLLAIALLAGQSGVAVGAQTLEPLKIAIVPGDISAQCWYAQDLGFFKQAGLSVEITPIASGAAIASAVVSGALDIGFSQALYLAEGHVRGLPFEILAPANLNVARAPTAGILAVKADSTVKTGKDLEGKTVAVGGLGNITDIGAKYWIDTHGGDSSKVHYLELPLPQQADAVRSGRVEAATLDSLGFASPGTPLRMLGATFDGAAPNFIVAAWFSTHAWIAAHPATLKKFIAAMTQAAIWGNTHRAESALIVEKHTGLPPAALEKATRVTYGTTLTAAALQPNIDIAAKYGFVPATLSARDLISKEAEAEYASMPAK